MNRIHLAIILFIFLSFPLGAIAQNQSNLSELQIVLNSIKQQAENLLSQVRAGDNVPQDKTSERILQERFTSNLKRGDSGEQVRRLQVLLNTDETTRVASSGPGSPGNETEFFGPATEDALRRFQQKYRSEISETGSEVKSEELGTLDLSTRWYIDRYFIRDIDPNSLNKIAIRNLTRNELGSGEGFGLNNSNNSSGNTDTSGSSGVSSNQPIDSTQPIGEILKESFPGKDGAAIMDFLARADQEDIANLAGTPYYELLKKRAPEVVAFNESSSKFAWYSQNLFKSLFNRITRSISGNSAQAVALRDFGGPLVLPIPCTCQLGVALTYIPTNPAPPQLLYQPPASQLKKAFNIATPGVWLLGNYLPGPAPCVAGAPPFCAPVTVAQGVIYQVGTTAAPGKLPVN